MGKEISGSDVILRPLSETGGGNGKEGSGLVAGRIVPF